MEDFSYDDDDIPEIIDISQNNSSVVDGKIKKRKPSSAFSVDASPIQVPVMKEIPSDLQFYQRCEDSKAVFTIDGVGCDATLSEKRGKIFLSPMNATGQAHRKKSARRNSGILKGRRMSVIEDPNLDGIFLMDLFGVQVKRRPKPGSKEEEGVCAGLVLSTFEHKDENILREKTIFMEHPSNELCIEWRERIMNFIKVCTNRPRSIKMFLQPYAGSKTGRNLYLRTVMPVFKAADVSVELIEIAHNEFVKQEMIHVNLSDFDCIACMGGDGTVSQVVDALMTKVQKEGEVNMKQGAKPVKSPLPFGIIPTGKTNNLAQSVMGCADPITAALHIVYGTFYSVDICSIYGSDKLLKWGFNSQYGFAGQVLTFMRRYKALGSKRVNAAFVKALTKSKLRAYECDIEYIPADDPGSTKKEPCFSGCKICTHDVADEDDNEENSCDLVQEIDPLNQSFTSNTSSVIELDQESPWRSLKGKFMNVGLFVIPGLCDIAPQGLSKHTHLSDGIIDLVLVKEVQKKEFVRYLKRHGNSKDQFDFPFVEVHKAKEIRLRPRFPLSWNYNDHDFNEIKYQMEKQESKVSYNRSMEVIADLASDDEGNNSQSLQNLDLSDDDDDDDSDDSKENTEKPAEELPRLVGPQYRKTFTEIEIAKRKRIARKKEEKQKAREESKMMSVWNIDNQIETMRWLDFKVHHGLLKINGCGVAADTEYGDVRMSCLP